MGLPPNLQLIPAIRSRLLWRPLSCQKHHLFASLQVFRDTMDVRTGKDGRHSSSDAPSPKSQRVSPPAHATPSCWDDPWADLWCNYQNEQRLTSQALADTTINAISGMLPGSTHSLNTFFHLQVTHRQAFTSKSKSAASYEKGLLPVALPDGTRRQEVT